MTEKKSFRFGETGLRFNKSSFSLTIYMKLKFSPFWLVLLFFYFVFGSQEKVFSQEDLKSASGQKVNALINEIMLEAPMLRSKENRITIYVLMSDLLWLRDEKRARQIAVEAADLLRTELAAGESSRSATAFPSILYGDIRNDFLSVLARRDPAFAQEMKTYTLPVMPKFPATDQSEKNQLRNWQNNERDAEQRIAFQAAAKDIGEARKIASKSLKQGVTDDSLNTLRRFQIKDSATADAFAAELIDKLLASEFSGFDYRVVETATDFLLQLEEKRGVFAMPRSCNCPAKPLNLDSQKVQRLASKWLDFVLKSGDSNTNNIFLELFPVIQKILPERNGAMQEKLAAIKKAEPEKFQYAELKEKVVDDKTTPEMLAELGVKKEGNERFNLYREAFIKAANNSKAALEKLLPVVSEHPDSDEKSWILDQINANLSGKTAEEGNLEKAYEMSQKVVAKDRRIGLLSFLALEFLEKGDREKAKQISDEIALLMDLKTKDKLPKAIVGYNVLPSIFRVFALTDPERAFLLLEYVLPEAGESLSFGQRTANRDEPADLRNLLKRNFYILNINQSSLKNLIDHDFERAKNLSKYLTKPELSTLSKALIAQFLTNTNPGFGFSGDRDEMIVLKN